MGNATCTVTCHEWKELIVPCPGTGCNRAKSELVKWAHASCGAVAHINSQALVRCSLHTSTPVSMLNVQWNCGHQSHAGDYKPTDLRKLISAMMVGAAFYNQLGATAWMDRLLESVAGMK